MADAKRRSVDADFNSIKVQLELQGNNHTRPSRPFQFHKGTIRTGIKKGDMLTFCISIP